MADHAAKKKEEEAASDVEESGSDDDGSGSEAESGSDADTDESDDDSDDDDSDEDEDDDTDSPGSRWRSLLRKLHLPKSYRKVFSEEGIDDLATLTDYTIDQLEELDIKGGHVRKLLKFARQSVDLSVTPNEPAAGEARLVTKTDVFLSHNWGDDELGRDNHDRVVKLNELLKAKGYSTWCDAEQMTGDIVKRMCQGIDNTRVILCFITKRYVDKVGSPDHVPDNCKKEFMYAARKLTAAKIVPICMEPGMRNPADWSGPVGMELGGMLYTDMSDDKNAGITAESDCFKMLCKEVESRLPRGWEKTKSMLDASSVLVAMKALGTTATK